MGALDDQGTRYVSFIGQQLDLEHARRAALDQRAMAVLTSSGAFTTLVFAVVTASRGGETALSDSTRWFVVAALVSLVGSALAALWATNLLKYKVTDVATLRAMLDSAHWGDDEIDARNVTATSQVNSIESLRAGNDRKAYRVVLAIVLQSLAFLALTVAVGTSL